MMESALKIMLLMWCLSFSIIGGQYVIGDVIGLDLQNNWTDFDGDGSPDNITLKPHIFSIVDEETINTTTENIVSGNYTGNTTFYHKIETFATAAANVAWELVLLLSGTYIFNFMYLMGIPAIFVTFFVIIYLALLARSIIGYIRGI